MERERNRPPRPADESFDDDPFDDESILQGYLARLMTLQDERQTWLEEADLQTAARDLGLSDADLERLQAATEAHRQRGRSFVERRLWDEAIDAFRQASALRPFDAPLFHELAQAHLGRWRATGDEADRLAAERYAHRTLQLNPEHAASYEVLQELKRRPVRSAAPPAANVRLSMALLLGGVLLVLALFGALLLFLL